MKFKFNLLIWLVFFLNACENSESNESRVLEGHYEASQEFALHQKFIDQSPLASKATLFKSLKEEKYLVLFIHGFNSTGGQLKQIAKTLQAHNITSLSLHLAGHRKDSSKMDITVWQKEISDFFDLAIKAAKAKNLKILAVAHSMGAPLLVHHLASRSAKEDAVKIEVLLLAPAVGLRVPNKIKSWNPIKRHLARLAFIGLDDKTTLWDVMPRVRSFKLSSIDAATIFGPENLANEKLSESDYAALVAALELPRSMKLKFGEHIKIQSILYKRDPIVSKRQLQKYLPLPHSIDVWFDPKNETDAHSLTSRNSEKKIVQKILHILKK